VWGGANGTWKPLHGRIARDGFSIEWHDVKVSRDFPWADSFHPQSLEICLNLAGRGVVRHGGETLEILPRSVSFYSVGDTPLVASREPDSGRHEFITVELGMENLKAIAGDHLPHLHPLAGRALRAGRFFTGIGRTRSLFVDQDRWVRELLNPPVAQAAEAVWLKARVQEIVAVCLFGSDESKPLFCDVQKSQARSRVERAIAVLRESLAEPPNLPELGKRVGCSHYYLSRTFSKETGLTIQQYLRRLRMERAAELLSEGRHNVTEAAIEVGYNSMSHFSQAFCQEMGVCPALYQKEGTRSDGR